VQNQVPKEIELKSDTFIVSRANEKGKVLYANEEFITISGYSEKEVIGKDHNLIRHPDMPKAVFKLLWETIKRGDEFNGYVKNLCKDGRFYWVFATITHSITTEGIIYYSVRKKPTDKAINIIEPLYKVMKNAEEKDPSDKSLTASLNVLKDEFEAFYTSYAEYILSLNIKPPSFVAH